MNAYYHFLHKAFRFGLILLGIACVLVANDSFGQKKNRQQLELEKQSNLQKIKELNQALDKTATQKVASLGQVKILNRKIEVQSRQIDLLSDNLVVIEGEMVELHQATNNLSHDLQQLKHEYGKMIFEAAKKNNTFNKLSFLFSSRSFNDFSMRYSYLKQYTEARKKQLVQMERVRNLLFAKQAGIETRQVEQKQVLESKVSETTSLEGLKKRQAETVQKLSTQEKNIQAELEERKKAVVLLDNKITNIIENEIAESRRRSERREWPEKPKNKHLVKNEKPPNDKRKLPKTRSTKSQKARRWQLLKLKKRNLNQNPKPSETK
jgi:murein hydrolase activator